MQFLMIISHDDSFRPTESLIENIHAWIVGMEQKGIRVYGNPLQPASDAVTVRIRNGEENIATGPFSDSKEQMCGYELIECKDLDEAVRLELTRFRGHIILCVQGVANVKSTTAVPGGIPPADGRAGSSRALTLAALS